MGTYRKMYGEYAFVRKSVWSDNEDGVLPSSKPHGVMDLDALADNIVSDKFPDDDEE